jgi:hypothetical protein
MWKRLLCVVVSMGTSACMTIETTTTRSQTLLTRRQSVQPVQGSMTFDATSRVEGVDLVIALHSHEMCRTSVVPVYRRIEQVRHEPAPYTNKALYPHVNFAAGALLIGGGALVYAKADSIAAQPPQQGQMPATPGDVRNVGLVLGALGLPFIAAGIIDLIRLRDTEHAVGDFDGDAEVSTGSCHERKVANTSLVLTSGRASWRSGAAREGCRR